jgi:hypothetical protein
MELSPSREAASCAVTQELTSILWNPKVSVLDPVVYNLCTNDVPAAHETNLGLFSDDTCDYAPEKHEHCFLSKISFWPHSSEFVV